MVNISRDVRYLKREEKDRNREESRGESEKKNKIISLNAKDLHHNMGCIYVYNTQVDEQVFRPSNCSDAVGRYEVNLVVISFSLFC